jgi:hypothetical protein
MTDKSTTNPRSPAVTVAAAAIAAFAGLTTLWVTVTLFQSRGVPMEQAVAASRACAHHAYQSEREACMTQWLAESRANWRTSAAR